jgi:putative oxidoreductase
MIHHGSEGTCDVIYIYIYPLKGLVGAAYNPNILYETNLLVVQINSISYSFFQGGIGPANFGTPEFQGFIDYIMIPYFGFLPGSPELWAALHDYVEFIGGIFFTLGFLTRPAALSLMGTMLSAVYFHLSANGSQGFPLGHVSNYSYDFEEPLLYALIFLVFWFNGSGPLSIDSIIYKSIAPDDDDNNNVDVDVDDYSNDQ